MKQAYSGPHKVLIRGDKIFKIVVSGKEITVSIKCIKSSFILHDPANLGYGRKSTKKVELMLCKSEEVCVK